MICARWPTAAWLRPGDRTGVLSVTTPRGMRPQLLVLSEAGNMDAYIWGKREEGGVRTRDIALAQHSPTLEAPRDRSQTLVAGGQGDDDDEGEEEARCAADVPPPEDDAKVRGVPGEEHLRGDMLALELTGMGYVAYVHAAHCAHVAMVHAAVIHSLV
jgi:hypothetical protein